MFPLCLYIWMNVSEVCARTKIMRVDTPCDKAQKDQMGVYRVTYIDKLIR